MSRERNHIEFPNSQPPRVPNCMPSLRSMIQIWSRERTFRTVKALEKDYQTLWTSFFNHLNACTKTEITYKIQQTITVSQDTIFGAKRCYKLVFYKHTTRRGITIAGKVYKIFYNYNPPILSLFGLILRGICCISLETIFLRPTEPQLV